MTHKVLIDYDMRGWADENETKIHTDYEEIQRVGIEPNPPQDSPDEIIASFCEENNYDLLTGDQRFYTRLLINPRVKAVQISKYDYYSSGEKQVYLVKIL